MEIQTTHTIGPISLDDIGPLCDYIFSSKIKSIQPPCPLNISSLVLRTQRSISHRVVDVKPADIIHFVSRASFNFSGSELSSCRTPRCFPHARSSAARSGKVRLSPCEVQKSSPLTHPSRAEHRPVSEDRLNPCALHWKWETRKPC